MFYEVLQKSLKTIVGYEKIDEHQTQVLIDRWISNLHICCFTVATTMTQCGCKGPHNDPELTK